ncbi:MAG: hypothetical protein KBD65_00500 [Candidatus Moranbacteria bacterium]|nr:hypothetical protein [Candidatus Moranbacteria bacterium]
MKFFSFFIFSFFALVLVSFPGKSIAESGVGGLSVSPVFQEIVFEAEDTQTEFSVTLKNETETTVTLRPSVVDFGSLDESGGVAFLGQSENLERKYSLASWMRPEKDIISLEPGEGENLRIVIENRENLAPGGHYGAVLFKVGDQDDASSVNNEVTVQQLVSVLVFAKKKGGEIYNFELKDTVWPKSFFAAPSRVELRFQNTGNVHIVPRGIVTLVDPLGRKVAKGVINQESGFLLPETLRAYPTTLQGLIPIFIPGKYTLTTAYRYDGKEDSMAREVSYILFPWQGLMGIVLVISLLYGKRFLNRKSSSGK